MSSYSVGSSIGKDSAVVRLLTSLEDQAHEVDESLEQFTTTRNDVLLRQKQALADYEAEMLLLDREGDEDNNEDGAEQ